MALNTRISLLQCDASVLDAVFERLNKDPNIPFLVTKDEDVYEKRPYYCGLIIQIRTCMRI
jgi:hypothetical protein